MGRQTDVGEGPAGDLGSFKKRESFEVQDPLERYRMVYAANHDRRDVVDLHFQSSRTAPVVLQHVLDTAIRANPSGVWVVTGSVTTRPQLPSAEEGVLVQLRRGLPGGARVFLDNSEGPQRLRRSLLGPGPARGTAARPVPRRPLTERARTACRRRPSRRRPLDWSAGGVASAPSPFSSSWGAAPAAPDRGRAQGPWGPPNRKKKKTAPALASARAPIDKKNRYRPS